MPALRPMNGTEFRRFRQISLEDYVLERSRNFDTPVEDERKAAAREYNENLIAGLETPGHRFWTLADGEDNALGYLWVGVSERRKLAFIYYILVEKTARGNGYGRTLMALLEEQMRSLGVRRILLNVFADNKVAQSLYSSQGYHATEVELLKRLDTETPQREGTTMPKLRPMTEAEYEPFQHEQTEGYILERSRNFDTTVEEERVTATRQMEGLLPAGMQTPGHRFWVMVDDDDKVLGHLWVNLDHERPHAFIYYVEVEEAERGKGYGKTILQLLEDEVRPLGVTQIWLNVFADNTVARSLYSKSGYRVTNQTMQKIL